MCCMTNNISWALTDDQYCKIRLWFTSNITFGFISKHILRAAYDISQIIELTHSTIFYSQKKEQNRTKKKFNYEIVPMYLKDLYIQFLVLIKIALSHSLMYVQNWTITFYNVLISNARTRLNHSESIVIFYSLLE